MNDDDNYNYKKYELLPSPIVVNGHTAYKIRALARVLENAVVDGDSKIRGLMRVYGESHVNDENWE